MVCRVQYENGETCDVDSNDKASYCADCVDHFRENACIVSACKGVMRMSADWSLETLVQLINRASLLSGEISTRNDRPVYSGSECRYHNRRAERVVPLQSR